MENEQQLNLKQKLNLETAKISWKELELFFAKGNLLRVEKGVDLISVSEKIANNEEKEIEALILQKSIEFMTPAWASKHCADNPDFWAVVVAPYVVCQLA